MLIPTNNYNRFQSPKVNSQGVVSSSTSANGSLETSHNNSYRHNLRLNNNSPSTNQNVVVHNNSYRHNLRANNGNPLTTNPSTNSTAVKDWNGQTIQGLTQNSKGQVLDANGVAIAGLMDKNGTLINTADNKAITSLRATRLGGSVVDEAGVAVSGLYVDSTMSAYTKNGSGYSPLPMGPGPELPPNQPFEMRDIRNSADKLALNGFSINSFNGQVYNSSLNA